MGKDSFENTKGDSLRKTLKKSKKKKFKKMYHQQKKSEWRRGGGGGGGSGGSGMRRRRYLGEGMKGFLCSTNNLHERDCVKEAYNLLNEYYNEYFKNIKVDVDPSTDKADHAEQADQQDEEDIASALKAEINELKGEKLFESADTGAKNIIFIDTKFEDPSALGQKIFEDMISTNVQKTRFLLKMTPIETTCRANKDEIRKTLTELFPKYFKDGYKSFQVLFKSRMNNKFTREEIIHEVAELVMAVNPLNFVDLKNPMYSICIEVIKGFVCIAILKDYNKLKKYSFVAQKAEIEKAKDEENKKSKEDNEEKKEIPQKSEDNSNSSLEKEVEAVNAKVEEVVSLDKVENKEESEIEEKQMA